VRIHISHTSVFFNNTRVRNVGLVKGVFACELFHIEVDVAFIDDSIDTTRNKFIKRINLMGDESFLLDEIVHEIPPIVFTKHFFLLCVKFDTIKKFKERLVTTKKMSFSDSLNTSTDKIILSFIDKVSTQFSISKEELLSLWKGSSGGGGGKVIIGEVSKELSGLNKNELIEMCKSKGLKHGGSKNDLILRITADEKQSKLPVVEKQPSPAPAIHPKLVTKAPSIALHRNTFGNFEHKETSFVFNEKTQKVVGKQNPDGTITPLTVEDINICNKFKFEYQIPLNLQEQDENEEEVEESEVELELEDDD
jgi:hypothetical protein